MPSLRPTLVVLTLAATCPLLAQIAPAAKSAPATASPAGDAVVLSPFVVGADSEKGYLATETLNGTRINAALKDIGAPMTIFTEELMRDLGANTLNDLLAFAPNTDPYLGSQNDTVGNGNDFLNNSVQYVTRGGTTNVVGQNFFGTIVPPDRYNAENFTFTRGPNAILFGLGNPAGAFTSSTKRARFQDRVSIEYRTDNYGSVRGTVDLNRVLLPGKLALRYAGLFENSAGFREPSDGLQRRQFGTLTFTPFPKTTLRFELENGRHQRLAIRPWPVYDGITPWLLAGSPLLATPAAAPTGAGIQNVGANPTLVITDFSPAGTKIDPMSWRNLGRSANPAFPAVPNVAGLKSITDRSLFPFEANVDGAGSSRTARFTVWTAYLEQQLAPDLFFEGAVHGARDRSLTNNSFVGNFDRLYIDVNRQLPNGAPNPNVGKPYVESFGTIIPTRSESLTQRATLSYNLDFTRSSRRWARLLGRHQAAAFFESGVNEDWDLGNLRTQNASPLPLNARLGLTGAAAFPGSISNNNNRVWARYYLDPATGATTAGRDLTSVYPTLYAGDPLPAANANGVTPVFAHIGNGGTATHTRLITRALAFQSFLVDRRLVATLGWRSDRQTNYRFGPGTGDANGLFPNPAGFDARRDAPASRRDRQGDTFTRGLTAHVLPWLSLYYNQSNNFQPNDTARNIYGALLPNPEGEGRDYGVKFSALGGRIRGDVSYYRNFSRARADNTVRSGVHGNLQGDINNVWATVNGLTADPKYNSPPYATGLFQWADVNTGYSDGYEFSVVSNLTDSWRLMINGSRRGDGRTIERGTYIRQYLAEWLPQWRANAAWMAAPSANDSARTVGQVVTQIENSLANFNALSVLPADSLLTAKWGLNFVSKYDFGPASRLRGWGAGATVRLRGRATVGFAEIAGVLDPARPYTTSATQDYGAIVSYHRRLFRRVDWRLQANITNLFEEGGLKAQRIVDPRDGTGIGRAVIFRVLEPRSYALSSTFTF